MNKDEYYLNEALLEAKKAFDENEVPIGAIVVIDDEIVGRGHNTREQKALVYGHAEINAIIDAEKRTGTVILDNATIYTTLEPCPMCSYAIMEAHIKRIVYSAIDEKRGGISKLDIFNKNLGPKVEICANIYSEESGNLLKTFFKSKR